MAIKLKGPAMISLEGGEGAGKSTVAAGLQERFHELGLQATVSREPGGSPVAEHVRNLFLEPPDGADISGITEALLVNAARASHLQETILPSLSQGSWVICDRFHDSSRVYQGILGGVPESELEPMIRAATAGFDPALTLLLDVDCDVAMGRVSARNEDSTRFDNGELAAHEKIRRGFLDLAKRFPERIVVVDGSQSAESVLAECWRLIEDRFAETGP